MSVKPSVSWIASLTVWGRASSASWQHKSRCFLTWCQLTNFTFVRFFRFFLTDSSSSLRALPVLRHSSVPEPSKSRRAPRRFGAPLDSHRVRSLALTLAGGSWRWLSVTGGNFRCGDGKLKFWGKSELWPVPCAGINKAGLFFTVKRSSFRAENFSFFTHGAFSGNSTCTWIRSTF